MKYEFDLRLLQAALAGWQKATVAKANPKARIRCNFFDKKDNSILFLFYMHLLAIQFLSVSKCVKN